MERLVVVVVVVFGSLREHEHGGDRRAASGELLVENDRGVRGGEEEGRREFR